MASAIARAFCQPIKNQIGVAQPARCLGAVSHATANSKVAETKEKNWKIIQNVDNSPLSRVIIAVKAGSRYETSSNLGITHLIRHAIQAGSEGGNDLGIYNSLEIVGSVLNVNTGRDLAFVSFNASNQYGLEIIEPLMRVVFRNGVSEIDWERYGKFSSKVGYDLAVLNTQPTVKLLENLHAVAYRDTLGNSVYCPAFFVGSHSRNQLSSFIESHYSNAHAAIITSGVNEERYQQLVRALDGLPVYATSTTKQARKDTPAKYWGGERREHMPGLDATYVAVAVEGASLKSKDLLAVGVLQSVLGQGSRIKYSLNSTGPRLSSAVAKAVGDATFSVSALNANYSDSGLFGFVVAAPSNSIDAALRAACKELSSVTKNGITDQELETGKKRLITGLSMKFESKEALMISQAEQTLAGLTVASPDQMIKQITSLTAAEVNAVAKKLGEKWYSMSSVGDLTQVPYLENIGELCTR